MQRPVRQVLAAASGSDGGLGKIGTIPASGVMYVRCDVAPNTSLLKWTVKANKAHAVQKYIAYSKVDAYTITLADATAVDDGDAFELNGETYTAVATEADAAVASRKFWTGANNAAAAVNLAALLAHPTYGVPGLGGAAAAAVDATDVITLDIGSAPVLLFNQGTSASNEIAFATSILAGLEKDGAATTGVADNSATAGAVYEQWVDGAPYAYLGITNSDPVNAMTPVVSVVQIAAR